MNLAVTFDKLLLVVRRDVLISLRHGAGFWLRPVGLAIEIAGLYYLASAIGPSFRPDGVAYFPFVLIGSAYVSFLLSGVNAFVDSVRESQVTGTIEVLMTTATPAPQIVVLTALSSYGGYLLLHLASVIAGLWIFQTGLPPINWLGLTLVLLLSLAIAAALGMFAAAVQLALQKGDAMVWLLGTASAFLTGTLFPVGALPRPLQWLAACLPITYALDGLRLALLKGATLATLATQLAGLTIFAAVLLPLSVLFFSYVLRRARKLGTLSFY